MLEMMSLPFLSLLLFHSKVMRTGVFNFFLIKFLQEDTLGNTSVIPRWISSHLHSHLQILQCVCLKIKN